MVQALRYQDNLSTGILCDIQGIPGESIRLSHIREMDQTAVQKFRHVFFHISSVLIKMSGPLINFGSIPSPQPTPSFWKEPTTTADCGMRNVHLARFSAQIRCLQGKEI